MALVEVESLGFAYPDASRPALTGVSLRVEPGEVVAMLGPSGSGKSTLIRALSGLVPHFHGGAFSGSVAVAGADTRHHRPADLAGTVATVFQDPEDQVVMTGVLHEVVFGLENVAVAAGELEERARAALEAAGAANLAGRRTDALSGGELQRVCLASALALEPRLLLLDEPTSQLDPEGASEFVELAASLARERGTAVLLAEQRPARALAHADRVLFLERGALLLDAPVEEADDWLRSERPAFAPREALPLPGEGDAEGDVVCRLTDVSYSYDGGLPALDCASCELRRGEIVALTGPNGSGKTTLARLATGMLEAEAGRVELHGTAGYLPQDSGRYLVRERVQDEVGLGGRDPGDALRALALGDFAGRHPRDLSAGERERVALAAVLVAEPDLLVLDEPTRGMDPERKQQLAAIVRDGAARRATLVVTHDLVFAGDVADRELRLGRLEVAHA